MSRILFGFLWASLCFFGPWWLAESTADVFTDVPQASGYKVVYALDIPVRSGYFSKPPSYKVDNAKSLKGSFGRIAYYLSLQPKTGPRQFVFVSVDAFTQKLEEIGVPHGGLKLKWQQLLTNMDIVTNVKGIQAGKALSGGNIEFWATNYVPQNSLRIPGADDQSYDIGDAPVASGSYGSMQLHHHSTKTTLFAYNNWGTGVSDVDIGIGNNTVKQADGQLQRDWTFRQNASQYTARTLQVLILPGRPPAELNVKLKRPVSRQIFQRQPGNYAMIPVEGETLEPNDKVEARAVALRGGKTTRWGTMRKNAAGTGFSGQLKVDAGWYRLEVRTTANNQVAALKKLEPFGVGEVFLIAGQSNSANHGGVKTQATDPRVSNSDGEIWLQAADPMLVATGSGGSPWPTFGDLLAKRWDVPIGILSVGWGGTRVDQWLPNAKEQLYLRLKSALAAVGKDGARAILWHQGESDTVSNTSAAVYARRLLQVISQSRADGGWDVPWYIALASYLPGASKSQMQATLNGQRQAIAAHPQNYAGPGTDDLIGAKWRYDNVHFNLAGLKEHAARWVRLMVLPRCQGFPDKEVRCESPPEPLAEPVREVSGELPAGGEQRKESQSEEPKEPHQDGGVLDSKEPAVEQRPDTGVRESRRVESSVLDAGVVESSVEQGRRTSGGCGCGVGVAHPGQGGVVMLFFMLLWVWRGVGGRSAR